MGKPREDGEAADPIVQKHQWRGTRAGTSSGDAWEASVQGRIYEEDGSCHARAKRSRSMMKKAKQPSMKRSMTKLKRMLTECLMEKNILEGRGSGRKPTTQFLRFGR